MILAREVDVKNGKVPKKEPAPDVKNEDPKKKDLPKPSTWWDEKKKEPIFWLIVTLILAYTASAILGADKANVVSAVVVLVGFHLVWWLLSKGKNWITPVIVYGIGAYFVLAWLQPEDTKAIRDSSLSLTSKGYHSAAEKLKAMDGNKESEPKEASTAQAVGTPAVYQPEKQLTVLYLVPGEDFKEVPISPGAKFNVECPSEAVALVYHRGAPQGIPYNCNEKRVAPGGVLDDLRIGFAVREEKNENGDMVPVITEKVRIRVITEL